MSTNPFDTLKDDLAEIVRNIVREELAAMRAQTAAPEPPQIAEEERLLSLEAVAERLGCGKQLVTQRMARGEIIWTVEAETGDRKVKSRRLDEYIRNLPEYTGRKSNAQPIEAQEREAVA